MLLGDGRGHFEAIPNIKSGLLINGEVKDIADMQLDSDKNLLIFSVNNDDIQLYEINDQ